MTSPFVSNQQQKNTELSPAQANFVYWLNGLAPVATCIVTPLVTAWTLTKKHNLSALQKYNQQVNEVVRQLVSGTIGLISYFGGGEATHAAINGLEKLFPNQSGQKLSEPSKQVIMIIGGTMMAFLGYGFVRPKINTELITRLLKREEGGLAKEMVSTEPKTVLASPSPSPLPKEESWLSNAQKQLQQWANNRLVRPAQQWIDKTLLPEGKPQLAKTAWVTTGILTAHLGALTLGFGAMKHFLGKGKKQKIAPQTPPVSQISVDGRTRTPSFHYPFAQTDQPSLYFAQRQGFSYPAYNYPNNRGLPFL